MYGSVASIRLLLISVASWPSISSQVVARRPLCFVVPRSNTPVSLVTSAVLFSWVFRCKLRPSVHRVAFVSSFRYVVVVIVCILFHKALSSEPFVVAPCLLHRDSVGERLVSRLALNRGRSDLALSDVSGYFVGYSLGIYLRRRAPCDLSFRPSGCSVAS